MRDQYGRFGVINVVDEQDVSTRIIRTLVADADPRFTTYEPRASRRSLAALNEPRMRVGWQEHKGGQSVY